MYTETTAPDLWEKTGSLMLPENAGSILLPLARAAIAAQMGTTLAASDDAGWLRANGAAFVTLMHAGRLRGCIGTLEAHRALGEDVKANAVAAAFRDPRFKPLDKREFDHLSVEVSVLSAIETIVFRDEDDALAQLHPEIDGVIFEYGHHRSTFLPQVWEDFRDSRVFLGNLKYKAGLPPDFWDPTVRLSRYRVSKWSESANG
ncbi:MAG TPA: AmmeMemoRadiSam system protein A [Burkholderiales bacterium]|jgi:AmmeMemoRadiSam system protein A|nr:AmmeMemoRadiSam system protein A [Burkholderiales bacterium]